MQSWCFSQHCHATLHSSNTVAQPRDLQRNDAWMVQNLAPQSLIAFYDQDHRCKHHLDLGRHSLCNSIGALICIPWYLQGRFQLLSIQDGDELARLRTLNWEKTSDWLLLLPSRRTPLLFTRRFQIQDPRWIWEGPGGDLVNREILRTGTTAWFWY